MRESTEVHKNRTMSMDEEVESNKKIKNKTVNHNNKENSSENKSSNNSSEPSTVLWTKPMILLLLHSYRKYKTQFQDPKVFDATLWTRIKNILKNHGYNVTEKQCRSKFDSLRSQHKTIVDHHKQSGNDRRVDFDYLEEMNDIFHDDPTIKPVSTKSSVKGSDSESDEERKPRKTKKMSSVNEILNELVQERKRRNDLKETGIQVERDAITALNRMSDSLKKDSN